MEQDNVACPNCGNNKGLIKFPCCGWVCMKCNNTFDELDLEKEKESDRSK